MVSLRVYNEEVIVKYVNFLELDKLDVYVV